MSSVISLVLLSGVLFLLVYIPLISFHLKEYYAHKNHLVYVLRYSNITIIQCTLFIITLFYNLFIIISIPYLHPKKREFLLTVNTYLAAYVLYGFVWKFWLLRYDIIVNNIVINSIWKSVINPKRSKSTNTSFYAKHRKRFGNSTFVLVVLFIFATALTTIRHMTLVTLCNTTRNSANNVYPDLTYYLLSSWEYVIPYILLLIMYFSTPSFADNFYIKQEMKCIFICLSINYAYFYAHGVVISMFYGKGNKDVINTASIILANVMVFAQFCAMIISTKWVNDRCQNIINKDRFAVRRMPWGLNLSEENWIDIVPSPKATTAASHNARFAEILASNRLYYGFMNHLSKEMCIECLLSVTEFLQFRKHIKDTLLITKDTFDVDALYSDGVNGTGDCEEYTPELFQIIFPDDVPLSWIVSNAEWDNKRKAYELYKKYIAEGCEFEINISSEKRKYFHSIFADYDAFRDSEDVTEETLMCLYDECCRDMVFLMTSAMQRFQPTP